MVELALPVRVSSLDACSWIREHRHVGRDDGSLDCLRDNHAGLNRAMRRVNARSYLHQKLLTSQSNDHHGLASPQAIGRGPAVDLGCQCRRISKTVVPDMLQLSLLIGCPELSGRPVE